MYAKYLSKNENVESKDENVESEDETNESRNENVESQNENHESKEDEVRSDVISNQDENVQNVRRSDKKCMQRFKIKPDEIGECDDKNDKDYK